jgi:hypothetical protein
MLRALRSRCHEWRGGGWLFRNRQLHDGNFPIRNDHVAGGVREFLRRRGTFHIRVRRAGSGKKQIRLNPIALTVHVRVDAVRPLRPGFLARRRDVCVAAPDVQVQIVRPSMLKQS